MHRGPLLVDTTTMLEGLRVGCWNAIKSAYRLETVETCIAEFQTGPKSPVFNNPLRATVFSQTFAAIHPVAAKELTEAVLRPGPHLDDGELALWAHAITRRDDWLLCGPDRASMGWGYKNGFRDRLTSLGKLLADAGCRASPPLRRHHEQAWLDEVLSKLALGIL